jgi:hypothetical protein
VFDFQMFDKYVAAAQQHGLVDPATNTANMAITLGTTPGYSSLTFAIGGIRNR